MAMRADGPTELKAADGTVPTRAALGVRDQMPVLAIAGTTSDIDPELAVRILPVLKSVVDLAADAGIGLVTGGTDAGVFHLLGLALAAAPLRPPVVVGVAPDDLVAGSGGVPEHSRVPVDATLDVLVRVPGHAWGDETEALSRLVGGLSGDRPSALLLVGGGDASRAEVVEHLARGRAVIVLSGSGRLADTLGDEVSPPDDLPALLAAGDVRTVSLDRPETVRRHLARVLVRRTRRPLRDRFAVLSVLPRLRYRPGPPPVPVSSAQAREWPGLQQRVVEAEMLVYPMLSRCDITARREQNRHRWFTVLALGGAFLTTLFGAMQAWLQAAVWPGIVVATLGGATSVLTTLARRQGTLHNFLDARTRAERLRSLYFTHLARPPSHDPAETERELHELERAVAEVTWGSGAGGGDRTPAPASDRPAAHSDERGTTPGSSPATAWHGQFLAAYRRHRLDDQSVYYAARARMFEQARRAVITVSALMMVMAALFGAIGAAYADRRAFWAFLAASVAALGTALTSFEAAFGLERYSRLYGESHRALMIAAVDEPRGAELAADGDARVSAHVHRVERILGDEVDTWSQYTQQPAEPPDGDAGGTAH
jgi:hypothetical protein